MESKFFKLFPSPASQKEGKRSSLTITAEAEDRFLLEKFIENLEKSRDSYEETLQNQEIALSGLKKQLQETRSKLHQTNGALMVAKKIHSKYTLVPKDQ